MPTRLKREFGRTAFGQDANAYAHGRPAYPERVYEILRELGSAGSELTAFEIGAGTGKGIKVGAAALGRSGETARFRARRGEGKWRNTPRDWAPAQGGPVSPPASSGRSRRSRHWRR